MKTLYALVICIVFMTTCKKYPEGGFTKRGPKNIFGTWRLTLYEVDGIDSTELINYNNDERYKQIDVKKEQTKYSPNFYIKAFAASSNVFRFQDNNTKISLNTGGGYILVKNCGGTPMTCIKEFLNPEGPQVTWEILELTKHELHLTFKQAHSYIIKMKK